MDSRLQRVEAEESQTCQTKLARLAFTYFGTLPFSTVSIFILSPFPFHQIPSPSSLLSSQWLISTLLPTHALLNSTSIRDTPTRSSLPHTQQPTTPTRWSPTLHSLCLRNTQTLLTQVRTKITMNLQVPQNQTRNTSPQKQNPSLRLLS